LVQILERWRVPRGLSVLLAFLIIFAIGGVIATQVTQLARALAADVLQDLGKELNQRQRPPTTTSALPAVVSHFAEPELRRLSPAPPG
jgi:predicted PurR-regulated permease PerM